MKPSFHYFPSNDSEPVDMLSFFLLALWIVATWKMVLGCSVCLGKPGRLCYNLIIFSLYHHLCCKGLTQQAWVTQTLYIPMKDWPLPSSWEKISECLEYPASYECTGTAEALCHARPANSVVYGENLSLSARGSGPCCLNLTSVGLEME